MRDDWQVRPKVLGWCALGLASATAVATLVGGCGTGKVNEPFQDAPRGATNSGPADVVEFPDGFSNVATKCDHGNRLYVAFHGDAAYAALTVIGNDPTCSGSR